MNCFETETPKKHYKTDRTLRVRMIDKSLEHLKIETSQDFLISPLCGHNIEIYVW